jgi:bacterioferritin-associated ferredoxin
VAAGCQHNWNDQQQAWHPQIEVTGQSTVKRLWIIGDGAGILGADAATLQGANCGYHIARDLNKMVVAPLGLKKRLHKLRQLREFLDRLYAPVNFLNKPTDETIVCRCEAITAGAIRQIIQKGCMGPNQLRAFCRAGMGPCMGRQCGLTIGQIFSEKLGTPMHNIGYFSIRPPLKPLTIEQLSSLKFNEDCKD